MLKSGERERLKWGEKKMRDVNVIFRPINSVFVNVKEWRKRKIEVGRKKDERDVE
jgi:hypothetical protein